MSREDSNITPDALADMRSWVDDCEWNDLATHDLAAADLTDPEIIDGIRRHYHGGVSGFLADR